MKELGAAARTDRVLYGLEKEGKAYPKASILRGDRCGKCRSPLAQSTKKRGFCFACAKNGTLEGDKMLSVSDFAK